MSIILTAYLTPAQPLRMLNKFTRELIDTLAGGATVQDYTPMTDGLRFAAVTITVEPTGYLTPFDEYVRPVLLQHVKDAGLASGLRFSGVLFEN